MPALGYVRQSRTEDPTTALSPLVQEDRIRALARAHGDEALEVIVDLDVSGAKVEERPGYMRLVRAIESGEAQAVYAYDLSRLHRNTAEALRFFRLAEERHVPVRLVAESIDTSGPTGELMLTILAAMNQWTSKVTSHKIKASLAAKRAQGERLGGRLYGSRPGEDADAVLAAYRETGSWLRASKALNAAGLPTRNGASRGWSPSAVRAIALRLDPALAERDAETGIRPRLGRAPRVYRFSRLLRCSTCGALLTASEERNGLVRYWCHAYATVPHARKSVQESALVPAIRRAVEQTAMRVRLVRQGAGGEAVDAETLAARRERVLVNFEDGLISKERRDARLAEIDDLERRSVAARWMRRFSVPPVIDEAPPEAVNRWLRSVFDRFVVDMDQPGYKGVSRPVEAEPVWIDPALRMADGWHLEGGQVVAGHGVEEDGVDAEGETV